MEQNWAVKEAGKVKNKDVIILEKPDVKRYLPLKIWGHHTHPSE